MCCGGYGCGLVLFKSDPAVGLLHGSIFTAVEGHASKSAKECWVPAKVVRDYPECNVLPAPGYNDRYAGACLFGGP